MNAPAPPAEAEHRFHDLPNGMRLHAAHWGDPAAPLMVFVHGFPEFWYAWRNLAPRFAGRFHCVAPDLRGFNLSAMPADLGEYRAHKVIADLALLIERLSPPGRPAVVVAHDWGGAVCWGLAIARPALVARLVSINSPHPGAFHRELLHNPQQQAASRYMLWLRRPEAEALLLADDCAKLEQFMLTMSPAHDWFDDTVRAAYRACWKRGLQGGLNYYRATPLVPAADGEPGAAAWQPRPEDLQVRVPVQVIWGMGDSALLPALLDGLDAWVPDLSIARIDGATHWVVHERTDAVAEVIEGFLAASGAAAA